MLATAPVGHCLRFGTAASADRPIQFRELDFAPFYAFTPPSMILTAPLRVPFTPSPGTLSHNLPVAQVIGTRVLTAVDAHGQTLSNPIAKRKWVKITTAV